MIPEREERTSSYLREIKIKAVTSPRKGEKWQVIDDEENETVMTFDRIDRDEAIAFADGYAYCKLMSRQSEPETYWTRIKSLIRGFGT